MAQNSPPICVSCGNNVVGIAFQCADCDGNLCNNCKLECEDCSDIFCAECKDVHECGEDEEEETDA